MDKIVHQVNRLINKIAKGDKNALGELFSLTSRMLYFMARKYLIDKSYAEDLVSDVFLTVVKKAELFDLNQNGLNWLYKIIHNSAINYNNKSKPWLLVELNEELKIHNEDISDWLETILVKNAIGELSDAEKQIIRLKYWEGLTLKEISHILGIPITTIHDRVKQTLKKLENMMYMKTTNMLAWVLLMNSLNSMKTTVSM